MPLMKTAALFAIAALSLPAQRRPGSQFDNLPPKIEVLTHFGERADISSDNRRVAFMVKSFGDAMTIDLQTRVLRCLTCNVPASAFLRVMHLVSGDYILIGPEHFQDIHTSRTRDNELLVPEQGGRLKAGPLGSEDERGRRDLEKEPEDCLFPNTRAGAGPRRRSFAPDRGGRRPVLRLAQTRQQKDGTREQGPELRPGGPGFLRQRQQDDVHVL